MLGRQLPEVKTMLRSAADLTAFVAFRRALEEELVEEPAI
jgi:hypothetical protein